jgi:hypothetical protein
MTQQQEKINNSEDPAIKSIADDLDKVKAISALNNMEGGKILVASLLADVVSNIDTMCAKHKDLTMQEFVSLSVDTKTKINMARLLTRAEKNKEYLSDLLDEALLSE